MSISVTEMLAPAKICATAWPKRPWPMTIAFDWRACSGSTMSSVPDPRTPPNNRVVSIRNGVVAIDSVTIAPKRLAAAGSISSAACASANSTKANSRPG